MDKSMFVAEVVERQQWLLDMWSLQQQRDGLPEDRLGLITAGDRKPIQIAQVKSTGARARKMQRAVATRQAKDDTMRNLGALLRCADEKESERRKGEKRRRPGPADGDLPEDGGEEGRDPPFLAV